MHYYALQYAPFDVFVFHFSRTPMYSVHLVHPQWGTVHAQLEVQWAYNAW